MRPLQEKHGLINSGYLDSVTFLDQQRTDENYFWFELNADINNFTPSSIDLKVQLCRR